MLKEIAGSVVNAGLGIALGGYNDRRQIKQQEKLQNLQIKGQKEMSEHNQNLQYDMWNKTNVGAQMGHLKDAGLNPALMYGGAGAGGGTVGSAQGAVQGGSAPQGGQEMGMALQLELLKSQKRVLDSQADKNTADAEKTRGVDTAEATARTTGTQFQNELNKAIGINAMTERYGWASDEIAVSSQKANAEWEAFKSAGFAGKTSDDPNSPLAKAMSAGLLKTVEELKRAKLENNVKQAEVTIKRFEAGLAESGISPNSPWQIKLITDVLDKVGLNPFKK